MATLLSAFWRGFRFGINPLNSCRWLVAVLAAIRKGSQ